MADIKGDILWHVEDDVVALAGNAHPGALQLASNKSLLLVHILADSAAGQGSDSSSDECPASAIAVASIVADDGS